MGNTVRRIYIAYGGKISVTINYRHKNHQNVHKTWQTHYYCNIYAITNEFKQLYGFRICNVTQNINDLWRICFAAIFPFVAVVSMWDSSMAAVVPTQNEQKYEGHQLKITLYEFSSVILTLPPLEKIVLWPRAAKLFSNYFCKLQGHQTMIVYSKSNQIKFLSPTNSSIKVILYIFFIKILLTYLQTVTTEWTDSRWHDVERWRHSCCIATSNNLMVTRLPTL